jgi:Tetracyclin repressor-like, C-terminal domain
MRLLTRFDHGVPAAADRGDLPSCSMAEHQAGELEPQSNFMSSPNVSVRLIESYTYLDLITGEKPDAKRAEQVLRMLLR